MTICEQCGAEIPIGAHPFCPHGQTLTYRPFKAYFDIALGRQIDSQADRWRAQRQLQMQPRDSPTKGDLNARKDRRAEVLKEQARA